MTQPSTDSTFNVTKQKRIRHRPAKEMSQEALDHDIDALETDAPLFAPVSDEDPHASEDVESSACRDTEQDNPDYWAFPGDYLIRVQ